MTNNIIIYFISLITINLLIIINLNKIAKAINLYDLPDNFRKIHQIPTPLIGGILFFLNIFFFILFFSFFNSSYIFYSFYLTELKPLIYLIITLTLIFLIGIYDDKYKMGALLRLILLSLILFLYLKTDYTSLLTNINFTFTEKNISLNYGSNFFTLFCLIVLIISCNMFDGMNMQSFIFYFSNFCFLYFFKSNIFVLTCCITLLFFSFLNYRGKIFLGDSGVYLLSTILGILYIKYYNFNINTLSADAVFSFLFFPVLDSGRCIFIRLINGKNPFFGDQLHFHHILLKKISYKKSLLLITIITTLPFFVYILNITPLLSILVTLILYLSLLFKYYKK